MLFYSDAEPLSICAVIGPDHTHCERRSEK